MKETIEQIKLNHIGILNFNTVHSLLHGGYSDIKIIDGNDKKVLKIRRKEKISNERRTSETECEIVIRIVEINGKEMIEETAEYPIIGMLDYQTTYIEPEIYITDYGLDEKLIKDINKVRISAKYDEECEKYDAYMKTMTEQIKRNIIDKKLINDKSFINYILSELYGRKEIMEKITEDELLREYEKYIKLPGVVEMKKTKIEYEIIKI